MRTQRQGGFLISKIHHLAGRIFARMLKKHGVEINPAQGRIMFALWREDEIPISTLAKKTALGKSTLTSMLDRLEEAEYVTRVHSKNDRRTILIKRTEKDKAYQKAYVRVSQEMTRLFYHGFTDVEIDEFEQYLERILKNLAARKV